jgi:hypothetical protein
MNVTPTETNTYNNFNFEVSSVIESPSGDGKDLIVFKYRIAEPETLVEPEVPSSGSSSGDGGDSTLKGVVIDEVSGCVDNVCKIFNGDTLNVEGHDIYVLLSAGSFPYFEIDRYYERIAGYNTEFTHEDLDIKVLDFKRAGYADGYVEFEYVNNGENHLQSCYDFVCKVEENGRVVLENTGKIIAAGEIRSKIQDATVTIYDTKGSEHYIDWVPIGNDFGDSGLYTFGHLSIYPHNVTIGTGENGGDEMWFRYTDSAGGTIQGSTTGCINDVCRIFAGDKVGVCGHTIKLEGYRIYTEDNYFALMFVDDFYRYETQASFGSDYENVTWIPRRYNPVDVSAGVYENPESYIDVECSVIENKNYLQKCDGAECFVNESTRIELGNTGKIIGFEDFRIKTYSDHKVLKTRVYYRGKSYDLEFDTRYAFFGSIVMEDLTINAIRLDETVITTYNKVYTYVFDFEVDVDYIFTTPEEEVITGPPSDFGGVPEEKAVDYDEYVPTSKVTEQINCDACYDKGRCYDTAYRKKSSYCSIYGDWNAQKDEGSVCEYSFECVSDYCLEGTCQYKNIFHRLGRWFSWIFGSGTVEEDSSGS